MVSDNFIGLLHDNLNAFLRRNLVKNAVASNQDEICLIIDIDDMNFGLANDALGVAPVLFHFGEAITERA